VRLKLPRTGFGADLWLTAGRGFVWATAQNRLVRVDPGSMRVRLTALPPPDWGPLAIAPDAIWVSQFAALYHLGPQGRPVIASFNVAQGPLVVAARYVWVLNPAVDAVTQIDPRTGTFVRTIPVGHDPSAIAYGSGSLWVASRNGTVTRIDPDMGRVLATVSVGGTPEGIAVGYGRVWVSVN
jgi:streptogramin lyase